MYLLYSFMLLFWSILLWPLFRFKARRRGTEFPAIRQRLGHLPENLRFDGRHTVWFHACSVGEALSLQSLTKTLHRIVPETRFVFSTTTPTGQAVARARFANYGKDNTFYFPLDLTPVIDRVLDRIRPAMVIIVDTEIWPNLLRRAHRRDIPVILVNGRISRTSFRYYRWLRPFLKRVLKQYRALMMQSSEDATRIREMGAPEGKITITGNIKFDVDILTEQTQTVLRQDLESTIGPGTANSPLIVAGSTHPNEEQIMLEAFGNLREIPGLENTRLLLAPRHPERFESVARIVQQSGFTLKRRTDTNGQSIDTDVILLDTIGELSTVYQLATVVFVGGTLVKHGGHSIMEPALYSKAIVVGPFMENFRQVLDVFLEHKSIRQTSASGKDRLLQVRQIQEVFRDLLLNSEKRTAMGAAARSVLERNRGAVHKTAREIETFFKLKYTQGLNSDGNY